MNLIKKIVKTLFLMLFVFSYSAADAASTDSYQHPSGNFEVVLPEGWAPVRPEGEAWLQKEFHATANQTFGFYSTTPGTARSFYGKMSPTPRNGPRASYFLSLNSWGPKDLQMMKEDYLAELEKEPRFSSLTSADFIMIGNQRYLKVVFESNDKSRIEYVTIRSYQLYYFRGVAPKNDGEALDRDTTEFLQSIYYFSPKS